MILLLLLWPLLARAQVNQRYVTVTTPQGAVQGARLDYGTNTSALYHGSAYGFLGVPYAQPPTGQLRFSEPVAPAQSSRVYDATTLKGRCPQAGAAQGSTSEDCLYLNIITTQVGNTTTLSAVMVFIGGDQGFTRGGTSQAEIPGTVRNLASRGVVVVTVQYRLGALGFFNLANSGVPANLGMLDQVMALQWIQTNIAQFGGDPNRITLCGHADGACAVAAHAVSPLSNGLFQQAILQSGSIYSCYQPESQSVLPPSSTTMPTLQRDPGLQYQPLGGGGSMQQPQQQQPYMQQQQQTPPPSVADEDTSLQIASMMCNVTSDQLRAGYSNARLRTCLQSLTVDVFVQFQGYRTTKWVIVRDNSFMPGSPGALAASNSRRIPMIIGTVQDEDADYVFRMVADGSAVGKSEQQLFDGWYVDFAKKNKLNGTDAAQVKNIIANNYGLAANSPQPSQQQQFYNPNQQQQQQPQYNQNGQQQQPQNQNYQIVGQSYGNQGQQQPNGAYNQNQPMNNNNNFAQSNNNGFNQNPSMNNNNNNNNFAPANVGYNQNQAVPQNQQQFVFTNTQYGQFNNGQQNGGNNQQTIQYLQVISKISSDAYGASQSVSQVNLAQQAGGQTRIFQFTHVTDLGRNTVPNTGDWKPVFRGQDQYFLFMSETIWTTGSPTPADFRVADEMAGRWTDFAKSGQVANWSPTPSGQYNYCNLNVAPSMQANYAPQARQVFNDQVYPVVQQATNSAPYFAPSGPSPLAPPPLSQNANVMIHNTNGSNSWSVSFSLPASALLPGV